MKKHWKLSLLCKNNLTINLVIDLGPLEVISRIKSLLNSIIVEVSEGEIFMMLGVNDSGKSP